MDNLAFKDSMVDVIIPAYNAESYIKECLDSVLNQIYSNIHVIVVDDGSVDNTQNILKNEYENRIVLMTQNQSGPSCARNAGILAGEGEFVAFMDSDDLWSPDFLKRTIEFMQRNNHLGYVFTENDLFTEEGIITPHWIKDDGRVGLIPVREKAGDEILFARRIWSDLAIGSFIPTSGILIRRSALNKVGLFDENLTNAEDRDLFIRLAKEFDVGYIETCLSRKRQHPFGLCQDFEKVVIGSDIVSRRLLKDQNLDNNLSNTIKRHLGRQWYSLGRQYLDQNKSKSAGNAFMKSFFLSPAISSLSFFLLSITKIYRPLRFLKRYFL